MPSLYDLYTQQRGLSDRKQRLFAVACCRRVFSSPELLSLLDRAEQLADGQLDPVESEQAAQTAYLLYQEELDRPRVEFSRQRLMARRAVLLALGNGFFHALDAADYARQSLIAPHGQAALVEAREEAEQCLLFHEIFGPPVVVNPLWCQANDHAAEHLARLIEAERCWHLLPILADALEDGGCTHQLLLEHLRSVGPHVRGCWALDAVLGRG
ncbi:MAG: hypothetical protein SNJ82_02640 [Gemmataceae bacterium]